MIYKRKTVKCNLCPLSYRNRVWGEGDPSSKIIFVGEAPGKKEDEIAKPFVGSSGKLLETMLNSFDIKRENVWITNYINCKPPKNNFSSVEATKARGKFCRSGLYEEIGWLCSYSKKILVPLGNNACLGFQLSGGITKIRGEIFTDEEFIIVPTYHPSYILRNGGEKGIKWKEWENDFKKIINISYTI